MKTMRPRSFVMLATVAMILGWSLPASAQDPALRQEIDQLKQRYEQMMHDLQQRIAALEQQLEKQKPTAETAEAVVSAAQLSAPETVGVPNIYEYLRNEEQIPERPDVARVNASPFTSSRPARCCLARRRTVSAP